MTERVVCLTIFKISLKIKNAEVAVFGRYTQLVEEKRFSLKTKNAEVAQLVERSPEEGDVTSSTLVLGTNRKIFVTKI